MKMHINKRIFFVLWLACIIGVAAVIPYSLTLQAPLLEKAQLPIPLGVLLLLQLVQNAVLFAVAVAAGLFLAPRVGLGTPLLEALLLREGISARVRALLKPSIGLGIAAALAIIVLDVFVFVPLLQAELGATAQPLTQAGTQPPWWQGFLASFYGGINEEVLMRLFLLSLLAFVGKFIAHTPQEHPTRAVLWTANVLTAILFGLGHLPSMAALVPLTPLVLVRTILLNSLAGIAFGYLYFTHGLEAAMLSHFSADIVLHVLVPLVM